MTLFTRERPQVETRSSEWGDSTPPAPGFAPMVAGTVIDERGALALASVFSCVGIVSDALSTLPVREYEGVGNKKKEIAPEPVVEDPFVELTQQDWLAQGMVSCLLRGNFYGQVVARDRQLYPTQIMPVHPDQVVRRRFRDGPKKGQIETRFGGQLIDPDDVFMVRGLSVPGSTDAVNPIEYCRVMLGVGRGAEMYGAAFFANSAVPAGYLSTDMELTTAQAKEILKNWLLGHQGLSNANLPGVLSGGAKWNSISLNPDDAQFLQTKKATSADVCMMFRVPPHMVGQVDRSTSWGTGIEQQEMGFVRNTLLAWALKWEAAWTRVIPKGRYVKFDFSSRLRGEQLARYQAYTLARNAGFLNVDEIRDREDLPPLPDGLGQDYLQPLNYVAVGSAAAEAVAGAGKPSQDPALIAPPSGTDL